MAQAESEADRDMATLGRSNLNADNLSADGVYMGTQIAGSDNCAHFVPNPSN